MTDFVGDNDHGDTLPPIEILHKEVVELRKQRLELRKQRDEARQMYCKLWELPWRTGGIKKAQELGWDCFKEGDIQRQKILDEITVAEKTKNEALDRLAKLDEELGLI